MVTATVDGNAFNYSPQVVRTIGDLVELIKVSIDPENIIVGIAVDGDNPDDTKWRSPLSAWGDAKIEIKTGSRSQFINQRIELAPLYLDRIREEFLNVRTAFRSAITPEAHNRLSQTLSDFKAFIEWYSTIGQMLPTERALAYSYFQTQVARVTGVCEDLLQQQLHRAWWAMAETIERRLDPELDRLKACCLRIAAYHSKNDQV